jgi:lipopolysaccharide transport system ATP-binding protein
MSYAIRISNLGKRYRVDPTQERGGYRTLRESLTRAATAPWRRWVRRERPSERSDFWALKDVSFEIEPGQVLGIIGRNGAGKSTLLKILSRITKPTTGQVEFRGRVGSLLEVGTGFHPELTGRENTYLNGAILGMSRREIARQFDSIVEFSGVEKFLETPVKRYSSGMYVRLAFAVAAHLDPEILLVDEVLAVGDQAFQQKCLGKMGEIAHSGRTVLLVSHNLPMLTRLASHAIWLERGRLQEAGNPSEIISSYCRRVSTLGDASPSVSLKGHAGRVRGAAPLLQRISLFDEFDTPTRTFSIGETLTIELQLDLTPFSGLAEKAIVFDLCDEFGTTLARAHSGVQSLLDLGSLKGRSKVRCFIENLRLLPGSYFLNVEVGDISDALDRVESAISFEVRPTDIYGTGKLPNRRSGNWALESRWELTPELKPASTIESEGERS